MGMGKGGGDGMENGDGERDLDFGVVRNGGGEVGEKTGGGIVNLKQND